MLEEHLRVPRTAVPPVIFLFWSLRPDCSNRILDPDALTWSTACSRNPVIKDHGNTTERSRMILRRDARRRRSPDYLIEHRPIKLVHFGVVVAGIRVAVAGHFIGLSLDEMPKESSVCVQPTDVVPGDLVPTRSFPRTQADIATQDREIDVLPLGSVAMPLNEGHTVHGSLSRVTHLPGAHDSMGGVLCLGGARRRGCVQS